MNEPSPYQPPLPQGFEPMPLAGPGVPPAVNVFGILHLVFAVFGVIAACWGLFVALAGNPFLKMTGNNPQMKAQIDAQAAMQAKIGPMSITTCSLSLLVAIPMIIAGIQLLKKRRNGLKWSNTYAISSLAAKVVNLILTLTIVVPAMQDLTREMMSSSRVPGSASNLMSGFMAGGAIGGVVVSCVYPVLALVLLNRPPTKAWFASLEA